MATPTLKTAATFYVIHGEDDLGREATLDALLPAFETDEFNTSTFDGEATSVPELLGAVKSYPFGSTTRVVIVKGLIAHLTRKGAGEIGKSGLERLLKELPELPPYARLVLVERESLRADSRLVKLANAQAQGFIKDHPLPKDATQWIIDRAKKAHNATIQPQAAVALASVTGNDLRRADNELFKLVAYTENARPITEKDVALLTPYVAEANVFELADAIATQDGRKALSLVHTALDQDPRDEGFGLFALVVRQFRHLLLAREHLDSGGSPKDVASLLKIHPYPAEKIAKQCRAFSITQLETIFKRLQKYDQEMKTGKIAPKLALDLLIASLSRK